MGLEYEILLVWFLFWHKNNKCSIGTSIYYPIIVEF